MLRRLDFRNFTYPGFHDRKRITLRDGKLEYEEEGCFFRYTVDDPEFLDVTGDGEPEALVVLTHFNACGSSATYFFYYLYAADGKKPKLLWRFATGSEAHGGQIRYEVAGRELVFELYGTWRRTKDGVEFYDNRAFKDDCCLTHTSRVRFGWDKGRMRALSLELKPYAKGNMYAPREES